MTIRKYIPMLLLVFALCTACQETSKTAPKKEVQQPVLAQEMTFAISGMTCEIGCARMIQSKVSKKEGVLSAKVVFTDSIAKVSYDANRINAAEIQKTVEGIAGGSYQVYDIQTATTTTPPSK